MNIVFDLKNYLLYLFLAITACNSLAADECPYRKLAHNIPSFVEKPTATQETRADDLGLLPRDTETIFPGNKALLNKKNSLNTLLESIKKRDFSYSNYDLRGYNFKGRWLNGFDFRCALLDGCNFDNARLAGADFRGASLKNASFNYCSAPCANFSNANLTQDSPQNSTFAQAKLQEAIFDSANLTNVSFSFADLTSASFKNAICTGTAFLQNTNLCCTNFSDASDLFNIKDWKDSAKAQQIAAILNSSNQETLRSHNLDNLVQFCRTTLPDGSVIPGTIGKDQSANVEIKYGCPSTCIACSKHKQCPQAKEIS